MNIPPLQKIWHNSSRTEYKDTYLKYLFLCALGLRLVAVLTIHDWENPNTWEYGQILGNLLAGKGFSGSAWFVPEGKTAFMAPMYVYLLYFCVSLFGGAGYAVLQFLQALIGALGAVLVFKIAETVFKSQRSALIAGVIFAIYPTHLYLTTRIHPLVLNSVILLCAVYLVHRTAANPNIRNAVLLGVILGAGMLGDPAILSFIPFALLSTLASAKHNPQKSLGLLVCATLFLCMVVSPWTIRNYLVFQKFIPVKSQLGYILWIGNHEGTTGMQSYINQKGKQEHVNHTLEKAFKKKLAEMSEPDAYDEFGKIAKDYILNNPGKALQLAIKKALYYWWYPTWLTCKTCYQKGGWWQWHHPEKVFWAPVLILSLVAIYLKRHIWKNWILLLAAPFGYTLLYALTTVGNNSRYRIPIEGIMIVFAAVALEKIMNHLLFTKNSI